MTEPAWTDLAYLMGWFLPESSGPVEAKRKAEDYRMRIKPRQRQPDKVRKSGPHQDKRRRTGRKAKHKGDET